MRRATDIRFGSYSGRLSTPVYREPWWFGCAATVSLEGTPVWEALTVLLSARAGASCDVAWFISHLPIALQIAPPTHVALEVVAARLEGELDVNYPFLVRERGGNVFCGFSVRGPDSTVRDSILNAFADRFLWAAS